MKVEIHESPAKFYRIEHRRKDVLFIWTTMQKWTSTPNLF